MTGVYEAIAREEVAFECAIDTDYIRHMVAKGGPCEEDDEEFAAWIARAHALASGGQLSDDEIENLRRAFGTAMSTQTMQGFALAKPHGYAGDFEIIDRIYQSWTSPDPALANWDHYFHRSAGARAVRNRKAYFHCLLYRYATRPNSRILKLGVGPGRSMYEWLSTNPDSQAVFDCVKLTPRRSPMPPNSIALLPIESASFEPMPAATSRTSTTISSGPQASSTISTMTFFAR